ncbi:MAG: hypothetical protein IAA96_02580 [Spirochaetes bacterium]|uniref:V-type ATP synthase subunit E n=1 Tax=Candidatus Avitreponema avistercoris TaxID=2840705 RepID=A0A9D9HG42_9SPIR|nr:hypothetical protein [Candidatus Avitreponema avistercoris]
MEELRSTEILDKEIREDARRKAEKILKEAEIDCREIGQKTEARFAEDEQQQKAEYGRRLEEYRYDRRAAVPLEKERRLIAFIDHAVQEALDSWFARAGTEKKLAALRALAERYAPLVPAGNLAAGYRGIPEKDVTALISDVFRSTASVREFSEAEAKQHGFSEGFLLRSEDGSVFCRVTCGELRDEILRNHREELAVRLFGADILTADRT